MRFDRQWYESRFDLSLNDEAKRISESSGIAHQVDHIVPVKSPIVYGFDIACNRRIITAKENRSKGNRHWPTMTAQEVREAIAFYKARGDL